MKILIVSPGRLPVPASRGGAVETLIDLLLEYNERYARHEIYVVSVWDREAEFMSRSYKHTKFLYIKQNRLTTFVSEHHIIPFRMLDYFYTTKVLKAFSSKTVSLDCIAIQNELVNGYVMKRKLKGRYIYHAHNDTFEEKRKKDREFLRTCSKVITVSRFLEKELIDKAKLDNTEVVYNGIDTALFTRAGNEIRAAKRRNDYEIGEEDFVIAFAGRLVEEKGIHVLLEALSLIPQEYRVVLLIIGSSFFGKNRETNYIRSLKQTCAASKQRIIFTGYVEHNEMPVYYAMADAGCVPSLWDEPFGLTVAEQMSMELPVITTDAGAIPEIADSFCGYIFHRDSNLSRNIASAIMELEKDVIKRKEMGKKARQVIEKQFSREVFCERWFRSVQIGELE